MGSVMRHWAPTSWLLPWGGGGWGWSLPGQQEAELHQAEGSFVGNHKKNTNSST